MQKDKKQTKANLFSNLGFVLKRVLKYETITLPLDLIAIIIGSFLSFFGSYLLKIIIEEIELNSDIKTIMLKVIIFCAIVLVFNIIKNAFEQMSWWRTVRLRCKVIIEKNEKIINMDYQTLENPEVQDMADKASNAIGSNWSGFEGMYNNSKSILRNLFPAIIAMSVIFTVNIWIIIITLALIICKFFFRNKLDKIDKVRFWDIMPPYRRKLQYVNNISRNKDVAKDLRIYDMKGFIEAEQKEVQTTVHGFLRASQNRKLFLELFFQILMIIQEGSLYGILIYEVFEGNITIADFTFMLASVRIFSSNINALFNNYSSLLYCARQMTDLRDFMKYESDKEQIDKVVPQSDEYTIEFKNVYFRYFSQENYALENISFTINPHEKIALVGYNGAGKTTLVKLLCGLYHPEKGEILVNGINVEELNKESYYHLFAPIFQDVNCFAFDVGENIAMKYQTDVDYELAMNALILAGLEEKITSLPNGIKTTLRKDLDENGTELSGGELQKMALARAIYKKAPFVILDEPTSALDAIAEYKMYLSFNEIIDNKSALYISHRLSSTRFCDRILMLKDGKIVEEGTHNELMDLNGEYTHVFSVQAKYYQDEVKNDGEK